MLFVGAVAIAQPNVSAVVQGGHDNTGNATQNGVNNQSAIGQDVGGLAGGNNTAEVFQGIQPATYKAVHNIATIKQTGDWNTAFTSQSNHDNQATQTQDGEDNHAKIWQDQIVEGVGPGTTLGGGDIAVQSQSGKHNDATIDQGTTGNEFPTAVANHIDGFSAQDLADANLSGVHIPFSPNDGNYANQKQDGDWNVAYASQGGEKNISWQTQNSTATSALERNKSNHYQYGIGDSEITVQNGKNNTDYSLQIGNGHTSTVIQNNYVGAGNVSVGVQYGAANHINVAQNSL